MTSTSQKETVNTPVSPSAFPFEMLKKRPVWLRWQWEERKEGKSKTKRPLAKVNDSSTWRLFKDVEKDTKGDGIGFAFAELKNGYVLCGIDIDGSEGHTVENKLQSEILNIFRNTYAEKSPSDIGSHIVLAAKTSELPPDYKERYSFRNDKIGVECYISGLTNRYFTYTGKRIPENSENISDMTAELLRFLDTYMKKDTGKGESKLLAPAKESTKPSVTKVSAAELSMDKLLEKARQAKNGSTFSALYDIGDTSKYNNDESRADLALCKHLAWWLQGDSAKIDTAFRQSALMRDKWEREDYRNNTISAAIADCRGNFYTPPTPKTTQQKWKVGSFENNGTQQPQAGGDKKPSFNYEIGEEYCKQHGYVFKYNVITRTLNFEGFDGENQEQLTEIVPILLTEYLKREYTGVTKQRIIDFVTLISSRNSYNPVYDMITKELSEHGWDRIDRIEQIYQMFGIESDDSLSRILIKKWLMQTICALHNNYNNPFSLDIVLVFQGNQGIGKTRFFEKLALNSKYFGEGECLDPRDKDRVMYTTSKWICELGEIGSTMKKDMDSVKAFLTKSTDKFRPPYGRTEEDYVRRTSFVGTVNDTEFLIDQTGNRRFATIPLSPNVRIDYKKQIKPFNALQLWVQVWLEVEKAIADGDSYSSCFRLTPEESDRLAARNSNFTKPMKAEEEVKDVINDQSTPIGNMVSIEEEMTVSTFIENNPVLKKYSAAVVGKVLSKLGYKTKTKRVGNSTCRVMTLPRLIHKDYIRK